MVEVRPLPLGAGWAVGVSVELPGTRLVAAAVSGGYVMCGALDVALLDRLLGARRIVAGRALGVRTLEDLLERPLEAVTAAAAALGVQPGMSGGDALRRMLAALSPDSPASLR